MLNPQMPDQQLRLHMGELIAGEVRVARSAIQWANSQCISNSIPLNVEEMLGIAASAYMQSGKDGGIFSREAMAGAIKALDDAGCEAKITAPKSPVSR